MWSDSDNNPEDAIRTFTVVKTSVVVQESQNIQMSMFKISVTETQIQALISCASKGEFTLKLSPESTSFSPLTFLRHSTMPAVSSSGSHPAYVACRRARKRESVGQAQAFSAVPL